jgi:hypothetical protein
MDQNQVPQNEVGAAPQGEKKNYTKWIVIGGVVLVALFAIQSMMSPARVSERMAERMIERAIEREGNGAVDVDFDTRGGDTAVTFKGEDGESYEINAGGNVALPDNWPESVPIMSGARITYAGTMMAEQGGGTSVAYVTQSSPAEAAEYYKSELPKNGWTIAMTSATPDGAIVSATRGEDEGVMVYIGGSPEGTTVTLSVNAAN